MQGYIAYTRVSTPKQGEGVSLEVQQDAIKNYAKRHNLFVALWFEEKETAAARGRPVFGNMLRLLRRGNHPGVILHKLDRGTRNLKDWAEIGELSDRGVEVHFVNEGLDLHSRGGRLSADIQAVVAADYIRNLREETRKGFYGRLRQGLYPLPAPIGYVDDGRGRAKKVHPVMGPLVKRAFELYATAQFTFDTLGEKLFRMGLRNRRGGRISRNGWSTIFNNVFYVGLIPIRKTSETFSGVHQPLVSMALFQRVQDVLNGKVNARTQRHDFVFRRLLSCADCGYSLVGERQKGHVYYRCHGNHRPKASVREEVVEARILHLLHAIRFTEVEQNYLHQRTLTLRKEWVSHSEDIVRALNVRLGQMTERLNRLTDAYVDNLLDRTTFEQRNASLLIERKTVEEELAAVRNGERGPERIEKLLELATTAWLSYERGSPNEKRELVKILSSNRRVNGKNLELKPSFPFDEIEKRSAITNGDPQRDSLRMLEPIIEKLIALHKEEKLPNILKPADENDDREQGIREAG